MHAIAVAAGAIVFPVALVVPWDPDSGGGIGPVIALTVAAAASITEGRLSTSWRGVAAGAEVGVLALAAYALGTYVAYDLGILGVSWSAWGDQNYSVWLVLLTIVVWGLPAALIGGLLGGLGLASRRLL